MSIKLEQVTKLYGQQKAVNNIDISIQKGEIVGFLGPNGAGKSTTMKMITGYLNPTAGRVEVCNRDVITHALECRRKIGYLPEHNPLYTDLYVKEFLTFNGSLYGLAGKSLYKAVDEWIEKTGLTPEKNKKIGQLSKGYRQRVGLAAAFMHSPEVVILDEPTTGLDPNQIIEIRELIKTEGKNKTVMLSTHIMQEVEAMCSRVIIINQGEIVADKPIEAINTIQNASQQATHFYIWVEFSPGFDAEIILNHFNNCKIIQRKQPHHILISTPGQDIRSLIVKLSAHENWPLIEIKMEENTIEDTFRRLTKS